VQIATKLIEDEIKYDGRQLAPHWIYRNFKLQGDAIVAFKGECEVKLTEMVDIEDVLNNEPIYSKSMLHFISEQFNIGLVEGVLRQRLLVCAIKEALERRGIQSERRGDDIFINNKKLTVSIATKSPTSVLIHTGVNIDATGAPVAAVGLDDLDTDNPHLPLEPDELARDVMDCYSTELCDIIMAMTKVRGVNG
jgi:hypothetical protein